MSTFHLGTSTVRRVGFGAMQLPGPGVFGPPRDHDAAIAVLRRAVELGVNHIDTAQYYGPDVSNALIRAKVAELVAAGATPLREEQYGEHLGHVVMLDPEGNEFCVA